MGKLLNLTKWVAALGSSPQTFLGAAWVKRVLDRVSEPKKRLWALRLLSLSPHYFFDREDSEYDGLTSDQYLETAFDIGVRSRQIVFDNLLKERLGPQDVVLDYGSGPGFLAKIIAGNVARVYACDISEGAIECARVLNSAPNLTYVLANDEGIASIPDKGIDVIVSFALAQHLSDESLDIVLNNCLKKLKPGGKLIMHVQLLEGDWKSEAEWRSDHSVKGKLKLRYGLHCFGRTEDSYIEKVLSQGFEDVTVTKISNLVSENFDDIWSQHLLHASKPS